MHLYHIMPPYTVQKQKYVYPVTLGREELRALAAIETKLGCSRAQAIRQAIQGYVEDVRGLEVIKLRRISKSKAKEEILRYLKNHNHAWTDEIADALRIDVRLASEILEELWGEKKIEPVS